MQTCNMYLDLGQYNNTAVSLHEYILQGLVVRNTEFSVHAQTQYSAGINRDNESHFNGHLCCN